MQLINRNRQRSTSLAAKKQEMGPMTLNLTTATEGERMKILIRWMLWAVTALVLAINLLLPATKVHALSSYDADSGSAACNNTLIDGTAPLSATTTIPLEEGDDVTKPALTVSTLDDDAITNSRALHVSGNAADDGSLQAVTVNGSGVRLDADGNFSTAVVLVEGENIITIVATDVAGNSTTNARAITYIVKTSERTASSSRPAPGSCS